jgi:hypothetical protein
MNEQQILELIKKNGNRFFSVDFIKKDNTLRKMVCRIGVTKHLKGGELPYDALSKGLLPVFDVQKQEYRMINLRTIQRISLEIDNAEAV